MMEDGVERDTDKPGGAESLGKEGWVKKCSGKFLQSYKTCYIRVEKSEIAVYENEVNASSQKCIEKLDLGNYDKCLELKSAFKKKNRLVLIRAPKCGNKIHDVKLQTQNPEERDAWIKALSDAIQRAKNTVFDEIKVDESCSLEHITRTRPKGNQHRRPPTRIHLKEAANISSDGNVRFDFDAVDTPSMTHEVNTHISTSCQTVKPPMPPLKSTESTMEAPNAEASSEQKVVKPPLPPSSQNKPRLLSIEDPQHDITPDNEEESRNHISVTPSMPTKNLKPPMPPCKEKKPNRAPEESINIYSEDKNGEDDEDLPIHMLKNSDMVEMIIKEDFPPILPEKPIKTPENKDDSPNVLKPVLEGKESIPNNITAEVKGNTIPPIISNGETENSTSPFSAFPESFPEPVNKITGRIAPPNKRQPKRFLKAAVANQGGPSDVASSTEIKTIDTSDACVSDVPHVLPRNQNPAKPQQDLMQSIAQKGTGFISCADKDKNTVLSKGTENVEVKAGNNDQDLDKQFKTDKVTKGQAPQMSAGQPVNEDVSVNNTETSDSEAQTREINQPTILVNQDKNHKDKEIQILQQNQGKCSMDPSLPLQLLNFSSKEKCVSMGDLLSGSLVESVELSVEEPSVMWPWTVIGELQDKVTLELENTEKLLNTMTSKEGQTAEEAVQGEPLKDPSPAEVLTMAVEKLRRADEFLREAKSLTLEKRKKRTSW
ncbi:uncharacterized protein plekho2 isoform X1 [Scleropages formosus]|uniref:uncharacterized protein plekho2 isoform X1 n=1 Tax=Scleropages formosus TaxID=113540 RepID=UPI0010FA6818|nr:pleckstrin homology domain-containing family O member 2 isoform X1 [Scleropages formosus]